MKPADLDRIKSMLLSETFSHKEGRAAIVELIAEVEAHRTAARECSPNGDQRAASDAHPPAFAGTISNGRAESRAIYEGTIVDPTAPYPDPLPVPRLRAKLDDSFEQWWSRYVEGMRVTEGELIAARDAWIARNPQFQALQNRVNELSLPAAFALRSDAGTWFGICETEGEAREALEGVTGIELVPLYEREVDAAVALRIKLLFNLARGFDPTKLEALSESGHTIGGMLQVAADSRRDAVRYRKARRIDNWSHNMKMSKTADEFDLAVDALQDITRTDYLS